MPITTLSLDVVGVDYENRSRGRKADKVPRRFEIELCRPGEPIFLDPEPDNPKDPNAVRVLSERNIQLGYVRAERAPWISKMLNEGRDIRAIFQAPASWGAIIRVTLDGSTPTLPPPRSEQNAVPADDDPGFWPDPIYDDN